MRLQILAMSVAVAALFPAMANAQSTCEQQRNNRVVGTVAGGGVGAVLGSAIAGHGDKTTGAVIGAIGGAIIGNQLAKPNADCAHAYGYYDDHDAWHANGVANNAAQGYFDRDGQWVDGAPNGYYDSDRHWVASSSNSAQSGFYDASGRWVPSSANGYYDQNGQWAGAPASGHYETGGRWVPGSTSGRYDADGRWLVGAPSGHRDGNGVWIADAQPGYYDTNGRWRAGPATGYYDAGGRWIDTSSAGRGRGDQADQNDRRRGDDGDRMHRDDGDRMHRDDGDRMNRDEPRDIASREVWLEDAIRRGDSRQTLTSYEVRSDLRALNGVRRTEARMRHYNRQLSGRDEAYIQARLDRLSATLRDQTR